MPAPIPYDPSPALKAIEAQKNEVYALLKEILEDHGVYSDNLWNDIGECIYDIVPIECAYQFLMKEGVYELAKEYFPQEA
jgi:hypothetical protein